MKKKLLALAFASIMMLSLAACGNTGDKGEAGGGDSKATRIYVISREDGSGTRGAFVELFGIEEKDESGNKIDKTIQTAEITSSTSVMMTTIAGDPNAIGYISLGSLNNTVKALKIDGVAPSAAAGMDGSYGIARPFNIAMSTNDNPTAKDFVDFILSAEGQAVVEGKGYIPVETADSYAGTAVSGKVVVAGSSSVTPVMEALKEAYELINPGAQIEIQQSDSKIGRAHV